MLQILEQNVPKYLVYFKRLVFIDYMIFEVETAQELLMEEFNRRVRLNSRYSLRAYATFLGVSSGALSEIMKGQRPLSLKYAIKIAKALGLNTVESRKFISLVQNAKIENNSELIQSAKVIDPSHRKSLKEDVFTLLSEWQNFALLNLIDCEGFVWSSRYISQRLGLTVLEAEKSMRLLIRMGLVVRRSGKVTGVKDYILSPDGISSQAIRKYHKQILEKAIESIEFQNLHERELSGVGFAVDVNLLPQIKKEISAFQDQLLSKYSKGKRKEVYFLEMILFKLTKGNFKNE